MLHQQSERRGTLTSRVTSDVDQITQFLQWGGVILLVSVGQITVTTVVMAVYSWQLTLVVHRRPSLPMVIIVRLYQKRLAAAYSEVRTRVGVMLGAVERECCRRRGDPGLRGGGPLRRSASTRPSSRTARVPAAGPADQRDVVLHQ